MKGRRARKHQLGRKDGEGRARSVRPRKGGEHVNIGKSYGRQAVKWRRARKHQLGRKDGEGRARSEAVKWRRDLKSGEATRRRDSRNGKVFFVAVMSIDIMDRYIIFAW